MTTGDRNGLLVDARPGAGAATGSELTWSIWVDVPERLPGSGGALVSTYGPDGRDGAELSIVHSASTSSQHNVLTVEFGADWSSTPTWEDWGRPAHCVGILGMALHDADLYVGSLGEDGVGRVHVRRPGGWVQVGEPVEANCVNALASFDGHLHVATTRYRTGGSAMTVAENDAPGGDVLRLEEDGTWRSVGRLPGADGVASLVVHDGRLYAAAVYQEGVFVLTDDGWSPCGSPGRRVLTLGSFGGHLVAGGNDHADPDTAIAQTRDGVVVPQRSADGGGGVFALEDDGSWTDHGLQPDTTQVYSLATWDDHLVASTWPNGTVFMLDDDGSWKNLGRLGAETEVMGLAVYNGSLYGGTLPHAEVHRYDLARWVRVGTLDVTPDALYRRAAGLAVYDGALVWGTLPSGRVHAMRTGDVVTSDRSLTPGRHHLVATRDGEQHRLYVDGRLAAQRRTSGPVSSGHGTVTLGEGRRSRWPGGWSDVRILRHAVDAAQVAELYRSDALVTEAVSQQP